MKPDKAKYMEKRPWGMFYVLIENSKCKIKKIEINPGHRLSYQYHNKRSEVWIVIDGQLSVILDDVEHRLSKEDSIVIPKKSKHRAQNLTGSKVSFIEVQTGEYFGEDDIVRLNDDYNRV